MLSYGEVPEDEAKANARLIAAAPDLLAACEAAMDMILSDYHPIHKPKQFAVIKAAIAKAKGEQE